MNEGKGLPAGTMDERKWPWTARIPGQIMPTGTLEAYFRDLIGGTEVRGRTHLKVIFSSSSASSVFLVCGSSCV